jgi:hypothetical protein
MEMEKVEQMIQHGNFNIEDFNDQMVSEIIGSPK